MQKKNRPKLASVLLSQAPAVVTPAPAAAVPRQPVLKGDAFISFIDEARSIGLEVEARRQMDRDFVEFLHSKGLFAEWEQWRKAKHPTAG